ncbi:hypothetical protein L1049_018953 [Liquidambar formosana]|uniref:Cytochrome P450 n=1 Tax=Liquidambar formosana TaxID=63359 RepID=A0AAP0RAR8_LIQFO
MEAEKNLTGKIISSVVLGGLLVVVIYVYNLLVLKPNRLRSKLEKQGIRGPSPSFLLGNIPEMKRILVQFQSTAKTALKDPHHDGVALAHDWLPTVFPCFEQWRNEYGPIFVYSTGNIQQLYIADPEMVKEVSLCVSLDLGKPSYLSKDRGAMLGQGIFSSSGPIWAHQRKIIAPELYFHKVKVCKSLSYYNQLMVNRNICAFLNFSNEINHPKQMQVSMIEFLLLYIATK